MIDLNLSVIHEVEKAAQVVFTDITQDHNGMLARVALKLNNQLINKYQVLRAGRKYNLSIQYFSTFSIFSTLFLKSSKNA